jgi:hypothetical protein
LRRGKEGTAIGGSSALGRLTKRMRPQYRSRWSAPNARKFSPHLPSRHVAIGVSWLTGWSVVSAHAASSRDASDGAAKLLTETLLG